MIDKFKNNKMTSSEEDEMFGKYFERKEENNFKNKWNQIIDNQDKGERSKPKVISIFRRKLVRALSAASVLLFVGYFSIAYLQNDTSLGLYSTNSKGDKNVNIKLETLIQSQVFNIVEGEKTSFEHVSSLYKKQQYKEVIQKVNNMLSLNLVDYNELYMLAAMACIQIKDTDKAQFYLKKINNSSTKYNEAKKMLDLISKK